MEKIKSPQRTPLKWIFVLLFWSLFLAAPRPGFSEPKNYLSECRTFALQNLPTAIARGCMVGVGAALVVVVERSISHQTTVSEHIQNAVVDLQEGDHAHAFRQLGIPEAFVFGGASFGFQVFGKPYGDFISQASLSKILALPTVLKPSLDFAEKTARSYGVEFSYILITSGLTLWMRADGDLWKVAQLPVQYLTYATAFWAMVEQGWFDQSLAEQKNHAIENYPQMKPQIEKFFGSSTAAFAVGSTVALIAHVFGQTLTENPEFHPYFSMPMNLFVAASIANLAYLYVVQKDVFRMVDYNPSSSFKTESAQDSDEKTPAVEEPTGCPSVFGAIWGLKHWRKH